VQWCVALQPLVTHFVPECSVVICFVVLCRHQAKVDNIGFEVGKKLVIRCSKSQGRLKSDLEVVKFICKDFWIYTFGTQVRRALRASSTTTTCTFALSPPLREVYDATHGRLVA